jgi:hypothetical protein
MPPRNVSALSGKDQRGVNFGVRLDGEQNKRKGLNDRMRVPSEEAFHLDVGERHWHFWL